MPTVITRRSGAGCGERGRSSSEGGVGSMTETQPEPNSENRPAKSASKNKMRQQFSLNDELLSRDRLQANQEVRKRIRKQQSLPDEGPKKYRTLRESFMMAVKKAPTFENLKNSFSLFRVPEEESNSAETSPPLDQDDGQSEDKVCPSSFVLFCPFLSFFFCPSFLFPILSFLFVLLLFSFFICNLLLLSFLIALIWLLLFFCFNVMFRFGFIPST